jgi:hypothetical protein
MPILKKGGSKIDVFNKDSPTLNPDWCDGHSSQCFDNSNLLNCSDSSAISSSLLSEVLPEVLPEVSPEISSQFGGNEPQMNASWCDGHHSQCMDNYNNIQCQKGAGRMRQTDPFFYKYKKYKLKYKMLIIRKC